MRSRVVKRTVAVGRVVEPVGRGIGASDPDVIPRRVIRRSIFSPPTSIHQ